MSVDLNFSRFHTLASCAKETDILYLPEGSEILSTMPSSSAGGLTPELNKRAWTALVDAAHEQYGAKSIERVWQFYGIDPARMIKEGRPLKASNIHMLEVGTMKVHMDDLNKTLSGSISNFEPRRLVSAVNALIPFPRYPLDTQPHKMHGAPSQTLSLFSYDPYLMDQELLLSFRDVGYLSEEAYIERLCKVFATRELPEGLLVPAPRPDAHGQIDYYVVHRCISKGDGLVAYALKPVSNYSLLKPTVVFRPSPYHPSGLDFLETWLNNAQEKVGWLGYAPARDALAALMNDSEFCRLDQKIRVCGHSLGGNHAQLFVSDHLERVDEAIFFNDPSVDAATAEKFAEKVNALPHDADRVKVRIYRVQGDIANYANQKHLFAGVIHPKFDIQLALFQPKASFTSLECHSCRIFDSPDVSFTEHVITRGEDLDRELDNTKRGDDVLWYERLRLLIGSFLIYPIFFVLSRIFQFMEKYGGPIIMRRTPKRQVASEATGPLDLHLDLLGR